MNTFSFVIHPIELKRDAARKYPFMRFLSEPMIEKLALKIKPSVVSHITGIESLTGAQAQGYFIACPLSARQLVEMPEVAYDKLVACGKLSAQLGAKVMGLGAFTSVAGDAGVTVAKRLKGIINVTSGNSYTVFTAIEGLLEAARRMDVDPKTSRVAIVGATGSIGAVCAKVLAPLVESLILVGRDLDRLETLAREVAAGSLHVTFSSDVRASLRDADLVLAVSAANKELIFPEDLKIGTVVCDVARPRDVSRSVVEKRDDVLVIEGGVIDVPGPVEFRFDFSFPERTAFACMSETMLMALEGSFESYTLGRDLSVERVVKIGEIANKHGFKLSGFRAFDAGISDDQIATIKQNAARKRASQTAKAAF